MSYLRCGTSSIADVRQFGARRHELTRSVGGVLRTPSLGPAKAHTEEAPCDILSWEQYQQEVTELLLRTAPTLTARHVIEARQGLVEHARSRGWIDG